MMGYDRQVSLVNYLVHLPELNSRESMVYQALCELGEATSWEILQHLGMMNPNNVRPRLTDMMAKKYYDVDTEQYHTVSYVEKAYQKKVRGVLQWVWRPINNF